MTENITKSFFLLIKSIINKSKFYLKDFTI